MNTLYPVFLKIEGWPVLVVGGGKVAAQKLPALIEAKARVTVIAKQICEPVHALVKRHDLTLHLRDYQAGDVEGFSLVVGATNERPVQQRIFHDAASRQIPVNIADVPELCTFYLSAVFHKGDLKIAVSTNGKSPTLGKLIRDQIGAAFGESYPELLEGLGELRPHILASFPDFETRKAVFEQFARAELRERATGGVKPGEQASGDSTLSGTVYLVGAGPGDPDLITVKGLRILRAAEVVVWDSLLSPELLREAPAAAERIYVGKRAGHHCMRQEEITALLLAKARAGKRVVRLKGGDPFVFGRGGEELAVLRAAGIRVVVVPGITAGVGVPTALGLPLTHRDVASSVAFATGHEAPRTPADRINWAALAAADTLVVYMGRHRLAALIPQWLAAGLPPDRPIAVIFAGTLPEQVVVTGTLATILDQVGAFPADLPGLIVVGDVVRFYTAVSLAPTEVACVKV